MTQLPYLKFGAGAILAASVALSAVPAHAVIPIYPTPSTQNAVNYNFFAGNTGYLRTWFVGKGSASFTVRLGAIVNGVDRGVGLNNQASALGELYNFGAITAGQSIKFYINVADTGDTYTNDIADNVDGVQHLYALLGGYTGGDFGIPLSAARPGSYFGFEDLPGGGDFNYTDLQFIARTGAIPEPASWALMIAGFGLTGAAMRRRAKVRVTYA
jgi:PEP-CTERM motif